MTLSSYQADIRPLFTQRDIHAMSKAFDLANYDHVRANAAASSTAFVGSAAPSMPPPPPKGEGPWPQSRVDLFGKGWRRLPAVE